MLNIELYDTNENGDYLDTSSSIISTSKSPFVGLNITEDKSARHTVNFDEQE